MSEPRYDIDLLLLLLPLRILILIILTISILIAIGIIIILGHYNKAILLIFAPPLSESHGVATILRLLRPLALTMNIIFIRHVGHRRNVRLSILSLRLIRSHRYWIIEVLSWSCVPEWRKLLRVWVEIRWRLCWFFKISQCAMITIIRIVRM